MSSASLLRGWLRISARAPLPLLYGLAVAVGWLAWLLPNEQRRIAAINLRLCFPRLSAAGRRRLLRRALCEQAKTFAEFGALWLRPGGRVLARVREVEGERQWRAALAGGRGALILTPHLGAWEIAGLYIASRYPMTAMYRPSRQGPALDELVRAGRERLGGRYVAADAGNVRTLARALGRGEVVGLLPDQDPGRDGSVFAPFFGVPAATMVLPAKLAQRRATPVFLIYALRRRDGYRLRFLALPEVPPEVLPAAGDDGLARAAGAINAAIEQAVRRCPEQYLWSYKRFKTRPPGRENIYRRRPAG